MRRIIGVGIGAFVYSVVLPLTAFAQEGSSLGQPGGPTVAGTGGSVGSVGGGGGTAFTGAEIAGLVVLAIVLATVGVAAVLAARRRSATARVEV
jgi:hypothetical protein